MNNIENLYVVIKNFLPYAGNYLKDSPIEPYLPQLQGIIDMIEALGGVQTISKITTLITQTKNANESVFVAPNLSNNANIIQQKVSMKNKNNLKNIDSYVRI